MPSKSSSARTLRLVRFYREKGMGQIPSHFQRIVIFEACLATKVKGSLSLQICRNFRTLHLAHKLGNPFWATEAFHPN